MHSDFLHMNIGACCSEIGEKSSNFWLAAIVITDIEIGEGYIIVAISWLIGKST